MKMYYVSVDTIIPVVAQNESAAIEAAKEMFLKGLKENSFSYVCVDESDLDDLD